MYVVQVTSLLFLNKYFRTLLEFNKVAEIVEFLYFHTNFILPLKPYSSSMVHLL